MYLASKPEQACGPPPLVGERDLLALGREDWGALQPSTSSSPRREGNFRVVYGLGDRLVLKLADEPHGNELRMSRAFPSITAEVLWQGPVKVAMCERSSHRLVTFHGLLQLRSSLATDRLKNMDAQQIKEFLLYTAATLTWVESKGICLCDVGPLNLAVAVASEPPRLQLVDLQDWFVGSPGKRKGDNGLFRLAQDYGPDCAEELKQLWRSNRSNFPRRFHLLCLMMNQGSMTRIGVLATTFNAGA